MKIILIALEWDDSEGTSIGSGLIALPVSPSNPSSAEFYAIAQVLLTCLNEDLP
jgi:hypothetical protein